MTFHFLLWTYGIVITIMWLGTSIFLLIKSFTIASLRDVDITKEAVLPPVSIIIPIRNEASHLEEALGSVCALQYPRFTVFLIEDRSTDATPAIVDRFAAEYPSLIKAVHIKDLPDGWLGKNHALYLGSRLSNEPWILFTDADVVFAPSALSRAMCYVLEGEVDHLTVFPDVESCSVWLNSILETFKMMLEIRLRPWAVRNPRSRASIGIGAFNLVKRSAYEAIGTHERFAMRPDDDLKLGEKLKGAGYRQHVAYGKGEVGLEWYAGVREFVDGLMKNMFSGFNYNIFKVIAAAVLTLLVFVLPVPLLLASGNGYMQVSGIAILVAQTMLYMLRPGQRAKWWYVLMIPFAGLLMVYILLVSAIKTIRQGGIVWRGHFYPLEELRKQR